MSDKNFKVKNGLTISGLTGGAGPLISDANKAVDSTAYITATYGGTGTTTAPSAGQVLYSANGTTYAPVNATSLPGTYSKGNTASRPDPASVGDIYSNTQTGYIEVYTSAGWSQLGVIPVSATIGTPTDVGTNVAYSSGSVDVAFTPGSGGGLVTSFTAVSTPGSISASGASSPVRVTGLTLGTSYTFTVTATNGYGNALASSSSPSVTTTSLPQAPTIGTATATTGIAYGSAPTASLTFTAGATGGKTISNYKYSIDDSTYTAFSPEDATSPVTIPGLTAGQSYTIKLKAVNANGDSAATAASNSITAATVPQAPTIGTASVTNATTVSLPFTAGATGGSAITSYTVTSSPSIALSTSGTTSPLTVTGTFVGGTEYTFTMTATNAYGTSSSSSSSNSIVPYPAYALSQTFNSSGNYTVPAGKTSLAIAIVGGGGNGNGASGPYSQEGGNGGAGSYFGGWYDYSVTPGTVYAVTVGGAGGGSSAFGNLINAVSPNGFTTNVNTNLVTAAGGNGGNGGNGRNTPNSYPYNIYNGRGGNSGGGAGAAITAFSSVAGLPSSFRYGGGGGGGGSGGSSNSENEGGANASGGGGGGAGAPYGGNGGNGAGGTANGQQGGITNGPGAGGGGGGGASAYWLGINVGGNGRSGSAGQVLVYIK